QVAVIRYLPAGVTRYPASPVTVTLQRNLVSVGSSGLSSRLSSSPPWTQRAAPPYLRTDNASWRFFRQRIVELSSLRSDKASWRSVAGPTALCPARFPSDVLSGLERPPQATASGRSAEDTSCTTNSRRVSAPSVSASPAAPSTTSVRPWAASRPGSTSGGG